MLLDDGRDEPKVTYLSGRMTGLEDAGEKAFTMARTNLRDRGYTVLCPFEASTAHVGVGREKHLRRDISMLMIADEVCVLSGWEMSQGAALEVSIAAAIGLPIWEFETGQRINQLILEQMDPRRFIIPLDVEEWFSPGEGDEAEEPMVRQCNDTYTPFRGASLSYCNLKMGHAGSHRDGGGRTW